MLPYTAVNERLTTRAEWQKQINMAAVCRVKNVTCKDVKETNELRSFDEIINRYDSTAHKSQFPRNVALNEDANAPERHNNTLN